MALGFALQIIWSWRRLTIWGRITLGLSALYLGTFAIYFYSHPWLDIRVSLQTEGQSEELQLFMLAFGIFGGAVAIMWICWNRDERKRLNKHLQEQPTQTSDKE